MITNEYFGITIRIYNEFDTILEDVHLALRVPSHLNNKGTYKKRYESSRTQKFLYISPLYSIVFIAPELSPSRQKLLTNVEICIGEILPKENKTFHINIISLVEGTLEIKQVVRYQVPNDRTKYETNCSENGSKFRTISEQLKTNQNVTIEHSGHALVKSKCDAIVIPCTTEFAFLGHFFSLNKDILTKAVKYEDFLFQIELEIKSTDIEILDIFLITVSIQYTIQYTFMRPFHMNSHQKSV